DYLRDALDDIDLATDPLTGTRYGLTGANPINFVEVDGHDFRPLWGPGGWLGPGSWWAQHDPCSYRFDATTFYIGPAAFKAELFRYKMAYLACQILTKGSAAIAMSESVARSAGASLIGI